MVVPPTLSRVVVDGGSPCIDCTARKAGVSVETLVTGLLAVQRAVRVEGTIGWCPRCNHLGLVLKM